MTEKSLWWTTDGTGDGKSGGYPSDDITQWQRIKWTATPAQFGVFYGYLSSLQASVVVGPPDYISVGGGAGMCYGYPYRNTKPVILMPNTPVVGPTGVAVVLRADWLTRTVRLALIQNTDGSMAIPAVTQSPGIRWEIELASAVTTVGGTIALTDTRHFIIPSHPDLPQQYLIPCTSAVTGGVNVIRTLDAGWDMAQGVTTVCYGNWGVPRNATEMAAGETGITISAIMAGQAAAGNIQCQNTANWGYVAAPYNTGTIASGWAAEAYPGGLLIVERRPVLVIAPPTVYPGWSRLSLEFERDGANGADTLAADIYFLGWIAAFDQQIGDH